MQQFKKGRFWVATKLDNLRWELYRKKYSILFDYGIKTGRIHSYEKELIENLRQVYYGGVPGSIILLCDRMCNGFCYDRGLLVTFGFGDDDFQLVDADIDGIRLRPDYVSEYREELQKGTANEHYGNHCFAERRKKDGTEWVYDTSKGLVFEKKLYYMMERPRITKLNSKQATLDYCEYQDIKNADIERDKYALPLILPTYVALAEQGQQFYTEALKNEIALFKQTIDYDGICQEINEDMRRSGLRK